ncbi:MAG: GNAT family N-acetyltransferase [Hormoscilla sp. GUM202]|nr:GNAT family N-acetyltransferase [Hormoscilla sp. GUM202]
MSIREAHSSDFTQIWPFFREIASAGETYAYPQNISESRAKEIWINHPRCTFVWEENNLVLGSYYIKTNHEGPGQHVCNCGYMVSPSARGKGIAQKMCIHSQNVALELGYKAMQFNFVASTNVSALHLWKKLGFSIVGTLPKAFNHPSQGFVDAFVMYKWLAT